MNVEQIPLDENFSIRITSDEEKESPDKGNESSDEGSTFSDGANESSDEEEDLSKISCKLENENLPGICYSECFFIGRKTNKFYLELYPKEKDSASIALWQLRGKTLKTFCLLFGLIYVDKPKFFLYQSNTINNNIKDNPRKLNIHGLYDIRNIKTNGLEEILCVALYVEEFDETESDDYEDESDDEYDEEKSDDKQDGEENDSERGKSSKSLKYKTKCALAEETQAIKTKGEIALIKNLEDLFLKEEDSDLIFRVGDKTYPSHRAIIKARSPVFHSMLTRDMIEKNQGVVDIEDCDPYKFRSFLLYLYTGKLDNMTKENMFELHHMSDKYDVKELRTECVDFIQNSLTIDNICDAVSLATIHSEHVLLTHAIEFFIDNVKDILTTINWQKFVEENPIKANELFIKTMNKDNPK